MATEPILLSIKPCYADLIFKGLKKAELRRRVASSMENRDVFVYVTSPARQLRGGFRVERVWSGTPGEVWKKVSQIAGINRGKFEAYYADQNVAYALKIADVWECETPATLDMIRSQCPGFVIPQSWRYVRPQENRFFRKMGKQSGLALENVA